jgi:hypothetical protein
MNIQFTFPSGTEGWDALVVMPGVPRVDDIIDFGDGDISDEYTIKHVIWTPNGAADAYVVLRR